MTIAETSAPNLDSAKRELEIALPAPGGKLEQDREYVVVKHGEDWRQIRLHDYDDVYSVQGLYERWVYDIFRCASPRKIRELLEECMALFRSDARDLRVLDLGAGNGCVAEELAKAGVKHFVGVDIYDEAETAAERDRPGLYDGYVVGDLTNLPEADRRTLRDHRLNCLTCVAALGFGDIPPQVFAEAFNYIEDGGWIVFTIKRDFVDDADTSGFSKLIRHLLASGVIELAAREVYTHRVSTDGENLLYSAFVARKRADISDFDFE